MRPENLDHVVAMVALFRPGPMDFIPKYIKRMHHEEEITYQHPSLIPIFEETYGIPVYQEQLMRAAVDLAGYTASEADDLRKAIAKKIPGKLEKHHAKFVSGAVEKGIPRDDADEIFKGWEEFARYGFNKSHAVDYGVIAVQTAFLKARYPIEYMTALLSVSKNDADKVAYYVADCRRMGIRILPPDINTSGWDFSIEDQADGKPAIRFGLGAIKNVGQSSVEPILSVRAELPFESLGDFARRVDLRSVGKRPLECIIKVGALDRFGSRSSLLESATRIHGISSSHFRAKDSGQMSLFKPSTGSLTLPESNYVVSPREILNWEKELLGLYVSDHPLSPHMEDLHQVVTHFSGQLADTADKEGVRVAGIVVQVRPHLTRTGKPMAFVRLEDLQGSIELVIFPNTWKKFAPLIEEERVILVVGKVDNDGGQPKVLADLITDNFKIPLEELPPLETQHANGRRKNGSSNGEPYPTSLESAAYHAPADAELVEIDLIETDSDSVLPPPPDDIPEWDLEPQADSPGISADGDESPPTQNGNDNGATASYTTARLEKDLRELNSGYAGNGTNESAEPQPADRLTGASRVSELPITTFPEESTSSDIAAPRDAGISASSLAQAERRFDQEVALDEPFRLAEDLGGALSRMVTVVLRASGDRMRDILLMRRIHGTLISYPGNDRFAFLMVESGRNYMLEFPNLTTGVCDLLIEKLSILVGSENVKIEDQY